MSILIKGMDKPTDCGLCPFEDFGYCNVKGERNTSESGIDADCPLVEIKDMTDEEFDSILARLIADRKTESNSEKPNNCDTCKWGEWYGKGYDITMMSDECGGCCSWNSKWTPKDEPQKDCKKCKNYDRCKNNRWKCCVYEPTDEPQTERSE